MKVISILAVVAFSFVSMTSYAATSTTQSGNESSMKTLNPNPDTNKFLTENKNKKGVITLPDGLQYKVLVEGKGAIPTQNDVVTVNYEGRLVNGKVFDSSYKRGEPATFPVSGVIPGWVEALTMMKQGSKWEVFIPSQLAYGEQGVPGAIGPNETLIFTIELLNIKKS